MLNDNEIKELTKKYKRCKYSTKQETIFRRALAKARIFSWVNQMRLGQCIVDFWFPKRGLIVEIDGSSHDLTKAKDLRRDQFFQSWGLTTRRFTNCQIEHYANQCVLVVLNYPESGNQHRKSSSIRKAIMRYTKGDKNKAKLKRSILWSKDPNPTEKCLFDDLNGSDSPPYVVHKNETN